MARAADLKNIAGGIAGSFISRNNDVGGYWAMGKLRSLALAHAVSVVRIDLLAGSIDPGDAEFAPMLEHFRGYLQQRLAALALPMPQIGSAVVEVDFDPPSARRSQGDPAAGQWCSVRAAITTVAGKNHSAGAYGRCHPHDPNRERPSGRASGQPIQ